MKITKEKIFRAASCIGTGILSLFLGSVMMRSVILPKAADEDNISGRIGLGIFAVLIIGFGLFEFVRTFFIERSIAMIGFEENKKEKARKKHLASRGRFATVEQAVNDKSFALDCGHYWMNVLRAAHNIGISKEELINDSALGEIFRSLSSVISVGREYTVYCGGTGYYVMKNSEARRIYSYIKKVDMYTDFVYTGTNGEFYVVFEDDKKTVEMRCEDYFDRFILDAYARAGVSPGIIRYPPDPPPSE